MNKDTVVGILGAVILVAAMVGIFYYEGTQAPGATGTPGGGGAGGAGSGAFRLANATLTGGSGNLAAGGTQDISVNVTQQNVASTTFTLTWTDEANLPQNAPDEFRIVVTPPGGGAPREATGTTSPLTVSFTNVNGQPASATAAPSTNGTGTWMVTVELVTVGQPGGLPLPGQVPVSDQGNSFDLAASASYWQRA